MAALAEVPPELAALCPAAPATHQPARAHQPPSVANLRAVLCHLLDAAPPDALDDFRDVARAAMTCRELYYDVDLRTHARWVAPLGYVLVQPVPRNFAAMRLLALMHNPHSVEQRKLLRPDAVQEARTNSMVPLVVSTTGEDSITLWTRTFANAISLPRRPTLAQSKRCAAAAQRLRNSCGLTADDVCKRMTDLEGPSNAMQVAAAVWALHDSGGEFGGQQHAMPSKECTSAALASAGGGVDAVLYVAALAAGLDSDEAAARPWPRKLHKSPPMRLRKAMVAALASMRWTRLHALFRHPGQAKALLKSLHVGPMLDAEAHGRLRVAVAMLRGNLRYPDLMQFDAEFKPKILEALRELEAEPTLTLIGPKSTDGETMPSWTSAEFVPQLAGLAIPQPSRNTPEAVLARLGNTPKVWMSIFEAGTLTGASVLKHLQSLILLGIPVKHLESVMGLSPPALTALARAHEFVRGTFHDAEVARIANLVSEVELDDESCMDVQVMVGDRTFRDARGTMHTRDVTKRVSRVFGQTSVRAYLAALRRAMECSMPPELPEGGGSQKGTALVVASRELLNCCRKGTPPATPPYAPSSGLLWRGEMVCLRQLAAAQSVGVPNVLLAGITWCQKDGQHNSIDLDLSVLVYDSGWEELALCDYTNLTVRGLEGDCLTHSGDWTSAPYPEGARETVTIDLEELSRTFPTAAYVCFCVFSYSGDKFDSMHDASVFVADASRPGTGPGGTAILSAARLTNDGRMNVAGYLKVKDGNLDFVNVDSTLNVNHRSAARAEGTAAHAVRLVDESLSSRRCREVRLTFAASVLCASLCNTVSVVSLNGTGDVLTRAVGEARGDWLCRILASLESACDVPSLPMPSSAAAAAAAAAAATASVSSLSLDGGGDHRIFVVGGTTEDQRSLLAAVDREDAVYCNLRAEDGSSALSSFPGVRGAIFRASNPLEAPLELEAALQAAVGDSPDGGA